MHAHAHKQLATASVYWQNYTNFLFTFFSPLAQFPTPFFRDILAFAPSSLPARRTVKLSSKNTFVTLINDCPAHWQALLWALMLAKGRER